MRREAKYPRLTPMRAVDELRRLERLRGQLKGTVCSDIVPDVGATCEALADHVKAELRRRRRP